MKGKPLTELQQVIDTERLLADYPVCPTCADARPIRCCTCGDLLTPNAKEMPDPYALIVDGDERKHLQCLDCLAESLTNARHAEAE